MVFKYQIETIRKYLIKCDVEIYSPLEEYAEGPSKEDLYQMRWFREEFPYFIQKDGQIKNREGDLLHELSKDDAKACFSVLKLDKTLQHDKDQSFFYADNPWGSREAAERYFETLSMIDHLIQYGRGR